MAGFNAMAQSALKPGALSEVHKELIALAIGVAGHCDGDLLGFPGPFRELVFGAG
ncbi:carboxymuconolactone decarboxylase family protein [Nitrosospira multiformis]